MSSQFMEDRAGRSFIVNWTAVNLLIRSWLHAKATYNYSYEICEKGGWFSPDIHYINYDFAAIRNYKDLETSKHMHLFLDYTRNSVDDAINWLEMMMIDKRNYDKLITNQNKKTTAKSMDKIHEAVRRGTIAYESAKLIRDISAETIIVAGGLASGGLAYGLMAGGSILKGGFKIQDTGRVRAGLAEAAFSFGFGVVGLKLTAGQTPGQAAVLNMLVGIPQNMVGEPIKAWVSGDDVKSGFMGGAFKTVANIPGSALKELPKILSENLKNTKYGKWAIPVQTVINVATDKGGSAFGDYASSANGNNRTIPHVEKQRFEQLTDALSYDQRFIRTKVIQKQYSE